LLADLVLGGCSAALAQEGTGGADAPPAHQHQDPATATEHSQGKQPSHEAGEEPEQGAQASGEPQGPAQEGRSEAEHVAPEPPQNPLPSMPAHAMASMMQMDDRALFAQVLVDQAEWRRSNAGNVAVWQAQGWYGGDYNKLWVKTEGEAGDRSPQDARVDVLWDRIIGRWWSLQTGARQDAGFGPPRTWAALGVQGIAPYWFDVEATFYVGEQGRTAARLKLEYDLRLTQRLILQPEAEANLYGKSDPGRALGSGLSDLDCGIRVRYEIRRELAPYIGLAWRGQFGGTADLARAAGRSTGAGELVAGVRAWF